MIQLLMFASAACGELSAGSVASITCTEYEIPGVRESLIPDSEPISRARCVASSNVLYGGKSLCHSAASDRHKRGDGSDCDDGYGDRHEQGASCADYKKDQ